ncbi:Protein of unknown function, partial [Gryllus bimaculatus]
MRVRNTDYLVSVPSNSFGFQARLLGTRQSKGSVNSSEGGRRRPTNAPTRGSRSPGRDTRRKRERRGEKTIEEAIRAAAAAAAASVTYSTPPHSTMTSLHVRQLAPPATIALLLAVVAGSFAFPAQDADFGSEGVRVKRVAGGQKVEVTVVPYQAKIEHPNGICGATIIHPSFVLTAKHCVKCGVTVARRASAAAAVVAHGAARPRLRDKAQLDERADGLPRERPPHRRHGRHRLVRRIGRPLVVRRQADGVVKAGAAGGESIAVTKYTRWPVRRAVASKVKEAEESAWASRGRAPSTLGTHAESHSRIRLRSNCENQQHTLSNISLKIKFTKSSLQNQVYKIKFTKSSLQNEVYKIKFKKSSLQNQNKLDSSFVRVFMNKNLYFYKKTFFQLISLKIFFEMEINYVKKFLTKLKSLSILKYKKRDFFMEILITIITLIASKFSSIHSN